MDVTKLEFDANSMLSGLQRWVLCESPSYDPTAVNRMQDIAAHDLAVMGAHVERITHTPLSGIAFEHVFLIQKQVPPASSFWAIWTLFTLLARWKNYRSGVMETYAMALALRI